MDKGYPSSSDTDARLINVGHKLIDIISKDSEGTSRHAKISLSFKLFIAPGRVLDRTVSESAPLVPSLSEKKKRVRSTQ